MVKMKFNLLLGLLALIAFFALFGCSVGSETRNDFNNVGIETDLNSVGTETDLSGFKTQIDLNKGIKTTYKGLSFMKSYLAVDKIIISTNQVPVGKEVDIGFSGLDGFKEIDGNIFIGASMKVTNSSGEVIVDKGNMLKSYETTGIVLDVFRSESVAQTFTFTFTQEPTSKIGNIYIVEIKIWDLKSDAVLNSTVDIVIK